MPTTRNADIAAIFNEIADLLEIEGANPFRIRAYRNAARTIEDLTDDLGTLVAEEADLAEFEGIGKDLAGKIAEIVETGQCQTLDELKQDVPAGLPELLRVPGLGPKRVQKLHDELAVDDAEQLLEAARDGRLREIKGFGAKTERQILEALETRAKKKQQVRRDLAVAQTEPLVACLQEVSAVKQLAIAGSYRRCRETVGDVDILVTAGDATPVVESFTAYDEVKRVVAQGDTRASVILKSGLQVDLRVVRQVSFGAALVYFTGSKAHNIALRRRAQQRGLKINEYGVFEGDRRVAGRTEASVYEAIELPFIPPELREDRGEIDTARRGDLPTLLERNDLRGDLHVHTKASIGQDSIAAMARAARECGLSYLAITDRSGRGRSKRRVDAKRLLRQLESIDDLNRELRGITLLKGAEVEIRRNGELDLPDEVLAELDVVLGAVHTELGQTRAKQTRRIVRAMQHPCFTMLAHPAGRRVGGTDDYDVDVPAVIREASERGCYLELNARPERLDLADSWCRLAKEQAVRVSVNSGAVSIADFDDLEFGVGHARRGWLAADDVLNARPLRELRRLLAATRQSR